MSRIQRIIFSETSLKHALSAVRGLHDMSTELIAADVFRQLSELATHKLTPATVWCGRGGLYQSKLEAIGNGEQRIESAILIDEPDLAGLAVDTIEVARLNASLKEMTTYRDNAAKKITRLRNELTGVEKERDILRAQLEERGTPPAGLTDVLPTAAVEGDQLVIRITTECLMHAVTCFSQWPANEAGEPIRINNRPLPVQEIIHELQREDEQGTNPMHRMLDEAALAALNNGSEAVDYDEVQS